MTITHIRTRWDAVRTAAAAAAVLADEIGSDLRKACTTDGTLLLPAGCESRLADFDYAVDQLVRLRPEADSPKA